MTVKSAGTASILLIASLPSINAQPNFRLRLPFRLLRLTNHNADPDCSRPYAVASASFSAISIAVAEHCN
jgi:hypothetical protein